MTLEEAIGVLESISAKTDYILITDDARSEALDMAIFALQAQDVPDTNVGDTISRQAAIIAFDCCELTPDGGIDANDAREILEQLPSAQPEIIQCKGCKWWSNDDYRECSNPNYDDGYVTTAGFYCGYAERRTDELGDS